MKSLILPLSLAAGLGAMPLQNTHAQTAPEPPLITVSGSSEVKVAPDEILLRAGVETRHENLDDAKRQNDTQVAKALAFIKQAGVAAKDVQTDYVSVEPNYEHNVSRIKPTHYSVRKSIELRLSKLDGFDGFVTGLLTNGVTAIHGIDFRTTQMRQHRDTARAMAIRAAREKADGMAAELGVKRGKVYNVSADDSSWAGSRRSLSFMNSAQSVGSSPEITDGTFSAGQISVSSSVVISFRIE